jgi:hypothetical protein
VALLNTSRRLIADNEADFKRMTGYDFPPLRCVCLPTIRFIICPRKDLEPLEIQNQVLVWLRQFHAKGIRLEAQEVALAIRHCWPHYEPPIEHFRTDPKLEGPSTFTNAPADLTSLKRKQSESKQPLLDISIQEG